VAAVAAPVGRDDVAAALRRAVDEAVAGRGRVVLLAGEAGIGKTTMLTEAARYAEGRGARAGWGWPWPGEGAPGYWPWVQVLRGYGLDAPEPSTVDAPASARFQFFDEVTSLLLAESRIQPMVVLLDDLQWADEPSLLLLDFLARRLPAGSATVVGAYRDLDAHPTLSALAARSTVLPLTGLPVDAVGRLVAAVVGEPRAAEVAAAVHRRTGGNPFFVQQVSWLLASGGAGVPPGVREALDQRFAGLTPDCVEALGAAAVVGPRFTADLVGRLIGNAVAEPLAEAVRARVLVAEAPGVYRFGHDLFREYAYDRLSTVDRARLHARVAGALEGSAGEVPPAEMAGHHVHADPHSGPAYRWSAAAARDATRRLAYEEAVRHWERAWDTGTGDRTGTLLELGWSRWRAGDGQGAGTAFRRGAQLARNARDATGLARAALGLHALGGRTWLRPDELIAALSQARDALADGDPLRLRVTASLARVLAWHAVDLERARALAAEAVATARAAGDGTALAACLLAQHNAAWAPGTAEQRRELAAEVAAIADETSDRELSLEARLLATTDLVELADPAFRGELNAFLRLADASGQPRFRYAALVRRGMLALLGGRLTDAERFVEQARALGEECGEQGVHDVYHDQLWDLRSLQGRRGELAGTAPTVFPDPESVQARGLAALTLLARGDRARAAELSAALVDAQPDRVPLDAQWLTNSAYATELIVALGPTSAAEDLYRGLLPYADAVVVSGAAVTVKGAVAHHLGVLAAALGRTGEAVAHLERAVAVHEQLGALVWALRSRYELARARGAGADLADVAAHAQRLGLVQLARDAGAAASTAGPAVASAAGVFTRDGPLWTVEYGGVAVRLRDAKGLADLAALLAVPGREIPAADLVAAGGLAARSGLALGSDAILDDTARRRYRARLVDLDAEIAEAEDWNDPERATRAHAERDALLAELAAATGLGGRARRLGDNSERARKAVTARIRDAIGRIERVHPALGAHLRASVTTGTSCGYSPPVPVRWRL
jgi:hypothetical protein